MAVTAVENDEYRRLTDRRFMEMFQPKRTTRFESGRRRNCPLQYSSQPSLQQFHQGHPSKEACQEATREGRPCQPGGTLRSSHRLLQALPLLFTQGSQTALASA